jgi:hypothetical protein
MSHDLALFSSDVSSCLGPSPFEQLRVSLTFELEPLSDRFKARQLACNTP